jgi:heme/copper-type cytochrome/quinol oxidase subunit 2
MEGIMNLHHDLMFFITFIFFFVFVVMIRTLGFYQEGSAYAGTGKNVVHGTTIEII